MHRLESTKNDQQISHHHSFIIMSASMPKRNMRWADDSSSDEEDTFIPPNSMTSSQLNDGFVSAEVSELRSSSPLLAFAPLI